MSQIEEANWLSALPITGYEIKVLLKTGQTLPVPWGRIHTDGKMIHVGIIQRPAENGQFPAISQTVQISETDILEISLREEKEGPEIRTFKRAVQPSKPMETGWLKDLPKSRDCRIYLLCANLDSCKEVSRGWIEYDRRKIYLNEIISTREDPETKKLTADSARHERNLDDVIAIIISVNGQNPQVFVRATNV